MHTSIVVSSIRERRNELMECIKSLLEQTGSEKYEIIVVCDYDLQLAISSNNIEIKVIKINDKGLSHKRNAGIKVAKGEIMAFIDDDAIADKYWLKNLTKYYSDKKVGCVGGRIDPIFKDKIPGWLEGNEMCLGGFNYFPENGKLKKQIIGANFSVRKCIFDEIGLFSIYYGRGSGKYEYGEEDNLINQIKEKYTIVFSESAIVKHIIQKEKITKQYIKSNCYSWGKNSGRFYLEYRKKDHLFIIKNILKTIVLSGEYIISRKYIKYCQIIFQMGFFALVIGNRFGKRKMDYDEQHTISTNENITLYT